MEQKFEWATHMPPAGWGVRPFVVAGAMKADLLDDLRRAVYKAIEKWTGLEEFRRQFKEIVQQADNYAI